MCLVHWDVELLFSDAFFDRLMQTAFFPGLRVARFRGASNRPASTGSVLLDLCVFTGLLGRRSAKPPQKTGDVKNRKPRDVALEPVDQLRF